MVRLKAFKVPKVTISRLGVYSRFVESLERRGVMMVSSDEIAKGTGVSSSQVRKDLAYFGDVGIRGTGYNVKELKYYILRILGLDKKWRLVIVGAGKLGCALTTYEGFTQRGFVTVGVFDNDASKFGARIGGLTVQPVSKLPEVIGKYRVRIGIIAVPAEQAQTVADLMVQNGVRAILNFAPVSLIVPENIILPKVDLSFLLEGVTFSLASEVSRLVRG